MRTLLEIDNVTSKNSYFTVTKESIQGATRGSREKKPSTLPEKHVRQG